MTITTKNYFKEHGKLNSKDLPEAFAKSHGFVVKASKDGKDWSEYESNETIKRVIDLYFNKLGEFIESSLTVKKTSTKKRKVTANELKHEYVYVTILNKDKGFATDKIYFTGKDAYKKAEKWARTQLPKYNPDFLSYSDEKEMRDHQAAEQAEGRELILNPTGDISHNSNSASQAIKKNTAARKTSSSNNSTRNNKLRVQVDTKTEKVEMISDELKFIRRYVNMHDKPKTRNQVRLFVNAVQRSIRERRIRKTSPYAKDIMHIQDELIKLHAAFENDKQLIAADVSEKTRVKFYRILGKEVELLSVKLIKSYIGLQGRIVENAKASRLLKRIESAISKKKISKRDPYWTEVEQILSNLKSFVQKNPNHGVLQIEERTLNGLQGIVDCGCSTSEVINGLPEKLDVAKITADYHSDKKQFDDRFLMNSMDFSKVNFQTIGLKGKWLNFMGDPELGFRAMTYGKPKMGKSYLMIEFAGYLANNHGTVLYAAKEEGKSETLKMKLKDTGSKHPNMTVSNYLPVNLGDYDFVFLDSVTKLKLSPDQLVALNDKFPKTSFIEIHQVTKQGSARGKNDYAHDPDVLIHVFEKGMAEQNGRYNQGAIMEFFKESDSART